MKQLAFGEMPAQCQSTLEVWNSPTDYRDLQCGRPEHHLGVHAAWDSLVQNERTWWGYEEVDSHEQD